MPLSLPAFCRYGNAIDDEHEKKESSIFRDDLSTFDNFFQSSTQMINISGELYIGLPIHNSGMAELQDAINDYTIKNQLKYSEYDHKDNKNYQEPNVLRLYEKPVTQIYNEKDGEGFAKYIASVLDKLFPHPKIDEQVGPDKKYRLYDLFDFGGRDTRAYEYASDYRPSNYWEDLLPESDRENTLAFNVTNYGEVKDYLVAKITFNFTTKRDISIGNIMRPIDAYYEFK